MGTIKEYKCVVCVLKYGTRAIRNKRVADGGSKGRVLKQTAQDVSNNDKEIRRERFALPEAIATIDPTARDTIEEDSRFATVKEITNPLAPFVSKTSAPKNTVKSIPFDVVECLMEVQFKDNCGGIPSVAAM